jgi:hypothetical protein
MLIGPGQLAHCASAARSGWVTDIAHIADNIGNLWAFGHIGLQIIDFKSGSIQIIFDISKIVSKTLCVIVLTSNGIGDINVVWVYS